MLQRTVGDSILARRRHDEELATIFETAAQLAAELDIETVLQAIVERARSLIGVLYVANRQINTFSDPDLELLAALAHHAALALENARLYEEAVAAARSSEEAKGVAEGLYKDLLLVNELHEALTDVLLAGQGVSGVARSLASTLNVGIVITDRSHFLLAQTNPPGIDALSADDRGCMPQSLIGHPDVRAAILRSSSDYKATPLGSFNRILCPVAAREELLGYIWATLPADRDSSDVLHTAIEQAARAVALEMLRDRAAVETEARLRRGLLDELLDRNPGPMKIIRHRRPQP